MGNKTPRWQQLLVCHEKEDVKVTVAIDVEQERRRREYW